MGFDDTWATATPDQQTDDAPPDGTHDVALVDADAFTSKAGNDIVKLEFQTVDKQYRWGQIFGFASPKAAGFTKGTCATVGVDVDAVGSLEELGQALKGCVGGFYEVKVERNGDFLNTYVEDGAKVPVSDVPADVSDFQPVPGDDGGDVPF